MAGIWGAIAATISTFVLTFYMARWHLHQHRLYWTELDRVTKLAVAAFVLGSLGFALRNAPLPVTITYAVLAAIAYPVLLYLTRFFEPVEILSIQLRWDKLTHRRPDTFLHLDMK
jgi:O-antigen/teichoic acid export membrane protein